MLCAQISYQIGDIYTFPDGSKGVVCYVNPDDPSEGWAVALNDVGKNGGERYGMMITGNAIPSGITQQQYDVLNRFGKTDWTYEGWENTRILRESGVSPAADAVDFYNGWYIPDAIQMRMIFSMIPVIGPIIQAAGGNVNQLYNPGRDYWTSTRVENNYMMIVRGTQYQYDRFTAYGSTNNTKCYIREVRNFSKNDAYAYWIKKWEEEGVKSGSMQVSPTVTTTYDAAVVFGTDTFYVASTVTVNETFDKDTLYETVCSSPLPYTSTVNPIFENLNISDPRDYVIRETLQTVHGCDSIITLMLHVNPSYFFEERDTICLNDTPYVWTDHNVSIPTEVGDYVVWDSLTSSLGCDSVYKLLLKIVPKPDLEVIHTEPVCVGNELQLSATSTNCSSFEVFMREGFNDLPTGSNISSQISQVTEWIAAATSVQRNGDSALQIGSSNRIGWIRTRPVDLSRMFTLNLRVKKYPNPNEKTVLVEIIIDGSSVDTIRIESFSDTTISRSFPAFTSASTVELRTIDSIFQETPFSKRFVLDEMVIYDNTPCTYEWNINGTLTHSADTLIASPEAGVYRVRAISARGCISEDSVRVKPNSDGTDAMEICENDLPVVWNGVTFTEAGTQRATITAANGCDSVVTMTLMVNYNAVRDTLAEACDSYVWYGEEYTTSGDYEKKFTTVAGCDSIVTLHLTINHATYGDTTAVECETFTWHGVTYDETPATAPTYTMAGGNHNGCDSIVTLNLTINHATYGDTTAVECETFTWHGVTYDETPATAPTYTMAGGNHNGCDSIVTLNLTINHA
ncbi:MAG: hypothetical protein J6T87_05650, partial [Bacteroidales bacterium]|nr:hypothetical protein [Bacteroidales bacterium]